MTATRVRCLLTAQLGHGQARSRSMPESFSARALPFGLAARQLLHLRLLRSARVVAGLLRLLRFRFLAGRSLALLPFFFC